MWNTLHRAAIAYPDEPTDEQKALARKFFEGLSVMLPCPFCQTHYRKYFEENFTDDTVASSDALQHFVYDLHEHVNQRLGITSNVKFDDVRALVNKFPTRFIDLDTGRLLKKPRFVTAGGVSQPSEAAARKWYEDNPGKCIDDRFIVEKVLEPLTDKERRLSAYITVALAIVAVLLLIVLPLHFHYTHRIQTAKATEAERVNTVTANDARE